MLKNFLLVTCLVAMLLPFTHADDQDPNPLIDLSPGIRIEAGGDPILVEEGYPVPHVADWNGDGKKDLLLGQRKNGRIRLYLNSGTDARPEFEGYVYLRAAGKILSLASG